MGESTISMAIFNSKLSVYQRVNMDDLGGATMLGNLHMAVLRGIPATLRLVAMVHMVEQ